MLSAQRQAVQTRPTAISGPVLVRERGGGAGEREGWKETNTGRDRNRQAGKKTEAGADRDCSRLV